MKNSSRKGICLIVQVLILSLFVTGNLYGAGKNKEPYKKYVHPRNYDLDLSDSDGSVLITYDSNSGEYKGYVNFTRLVKKDFPQKNDQLTLHFKGKALNDCEDITVSFYDKENNMLPISENNNQLLGTGIKKNVEFSGKLIFLVSENVTSSLVLELKSNKVVLEGKKESTSFRFKRTVESTDTVKEAAAEQKAVKSNREIIEVQSEIQSLEEINSIKAAEEAARLAAAERKKKVAEEAVRQEKERIEAERLKAEKIEQERLEAERLEQERLKEQEALKIALESASKVTRYEKEFLNDFMVDDASEEINVEEVKSNLIENVNDFDEDGKTQLMIAAKKGNDWQIRTLINGGADVNLTDKDGWTPLMYSVRYQETMTCIDLLIDAGSDVKHLNKYNSSALALAASYNNNPEIIKKLLSFYSPSEREVLKAMVLLITENRASDYLQIAKLNIFFDNSIPVNAFYDGKTLLMYACEYGNSTEIIKLLIDNDAVTTLRSSEGKTAFEYAKENPMLEHDDVYWSLNK